MYAPDFDGCWAKVERARRHLSELESTIDAYLQDPTHQVSIDAEYDPASGYHIYRATNHFHDFEPFLLSIGVWIGDVVHNLHSALDHLAFQLALTYGNGAIGNPRQVYFPINSARSFNERRPHYQRLFGVSQTDRLESLQPFKGRQGREDSWTGPYVHQLDLLQALSNTDKHQIVTPLLTSRGQTGVKFPEGTLVAEPDVIRGFSTGQSVSPGVEVYRARMQGSNVAPYMRDVGEIWLSISLSEGRPVVATLNRILSYVTLVIRQFNLGDQIAGHVE